MINSILPFTYPITRSSRTYFLIEPLNLRVSVSNRIIEGRQINSILDISKNIHSLEFLGLSSQDSNSFRSYIFQRFNLSNYHVLLQGKFIYREFPDRYSSFKIRDSYENTKSFIFIGEPIVFDTFQTSNGVFYYDAFSAIPDKLGYLLMTPK